MSGLGSDVVLTDVSELTTVKAWMESQQNRLWDSLSQ